MFQSPAHRENKFYLLTMSEHLHVLVKSRKFRRGAYDFPDHGIADEIAELAYKNRIFLKHGNHGIDCYLTEILDIPRDVAKVGDHPFVT